MKYRAFGNDHVQVSEIGLGCWQLGGSEWGAVTEKEALAILEASFEQGVTFYDTADVYGMGRSEIFIGKFLQRHSEELFIATKLGRTPDLYPNGYTQKRVTEHVEASLKRLGVESLDLVQLHCVPPEVVRDGEICEWLRILRKEGKIKRFGASVETMEDAKACMEYDDIYSLQIIFNIFRQKALEEVLPQARQKGVGIIVRLPLNSGLLSGKMNPKTEFGEKDHRNFNRDGKAFYVGETFGGLIYEKGLELVEQLRSYVPHQSSMAQFALKWCLDQSEVSTVIPGATRIMQARMNAAVSNMPSLGTEMHKSLRKFYQEEVAEHIRGPY